MNYRDLIPCAPPTKDVNHKFFPKGLIVVLSSVYISEVWVLFIRLVLKRMDKCIILRPPDALCGQLISLLVLGSQVPAEQYNVDDEQGIAANMGSKRNEVAGSIPA